MRLVNDLDKTEPSAAVEAGTRSGIFASASLASPPVLIADDDEDILEVVEGAPRRTIPA